MKYPLLLCLFIFLFAASSFSQTIRYVKPGGAGTSSGNSWANASGDIQATINGSDSGDQIWVAAGTYKPNRVADDLGNINGGRRSCAFVLKADVQMYGGFAGTETDTSQRDWTTNPTILSGDFYDDDSISGYGNTFGLLNNSDNAYHVVIAVGYMGSAVLDGFEVTGGNANVSNLSVTVYYIYTVPHNEGGGIYNRSSLAINNCKIIGNAATEGAGIFSMETYSNITNCIITQNNSYNAGGGIVVISPSAPVISNCVISSNKAKDLGGGVYSSGSTITFKSCAIKDNYTTIGLNNPASTGGGGIAMSQSLITLKNCALNNNHTDGYGGAIYNFWGPDGSVIDNCIIDNNSAGYQGGAILNKGSGNMTSLPSPVISNCLIRNNQAAQGGGIHNDNQAWIAIYNSVLNENHATQNGGAICNTAYSWSYSNNCTIGHNKADTAGGGIYNSSDSRSYLWNSIIWENNSGIGGNGYITRNNSLIQGLTSDIYGNLDGTITANDPLFLDPDHGNFGLLSCSPAINAGDSVYYDNYINTAYSDSDIIGNDRITGTNIDMGAYEYQNDTMLISSDSSGILYVKKGGAGTQSGNSWTNAVPELAMALKAATTNTSIKQIWVAEGIYKPLYRADNMTCGPNPNNAFVLVNGVQLFGGFTGNETSVNQRNWNLHKTILSGDYGNNDSITGHVDSLHIYKNEDNTYHVVIASSITSGLLDGFSIQGGNATANDSISVNGNTIYQNKGGALYNTSASLVLVNCAVYDNNAIYGAALYQQSILSSSLINCTFSNNEADSPGVIYSEVDSTIITRNTIVWGNTTGINGGLIDRKFSLIQGLTGMSDGNLNGTSDPAFVDPDHNDYNLSSYSPVIDKGDSTYYPDTTIMANYDRITGNNIDMGAYEYHGPFITPTAGVVYVKKDGSGNQSGANWNNAASELAVVLKASLSDSSIKQIWVAAGIYNPIYRADSPNFISIANRNNAFVLTKRIQLYGGFIGTETDTSQRDWITNKTILSGDFSNNDIVSGSSSTLTINNTGENAYHVIINVSLDSTTVVDGFVIKGGCADGLGKITLKTKDISRANGGAIYNSGSATLYRNCDIINNKSNVYGGGIYDDNSSSIYLVNCSINNNLSPSGAGICNNSHSSINTQNCVIHGNNSISYGGGLYNSSSSKITLSNSSLDSNYSAFWGGGLYSNHSLADITNCTFNYNNAIYSGGGIFADDSAVINMIDCSMMNNKSDGTTVPSGAGGALFGYHSIVNLNKCAIHNNSAQNGDGGGLQFTSTSAKITNCTIDSNTAQYGGGGENYSSIVTYVNCAIRHNSAPFGGGILNGDESLLNFINCNISYNSAVNGGGMMNQGILISSFLTNCTMYANTSNSGGQIYNEGDSIFINNSILIGGNSGIVNIKPGSIIIARSSLIQGMSGGSDGNLPDTINPFFADTSTEDLSLQFGSPLINKGNNSLYGDSLMLASDSDLIGNPRLNRGNIDLGAYENPTPGLPQNIHVSNSIKTYGDSAFYPADTATSGLQISYTSSDTSIASTMQDTANGEWKIAIHKAGIVTITASQSGNGFYDPANDTTFILTINKAPLTITANSKTKVYGDTDPVFTYKVNGLVNGDDSTIVFAYLRRNNGENVGKYLILQDSSYAGNNYAITYIPDTLSILKGVLTITGNQLTKVYGQSDPPITYSVSGFVNGDDSTMINVSLYRVTGENVGTYAILVDTIIVSNYSTVYNGKTLYITQAPLTIKADQQTKVYGDTDPVFTYTASGLVFGDSLSMMSGKLGRDTGENVGSYNITIGDLLPGNNYYINLISDTFTITQASLTIKANAKTKAYGAPDPVLDYTVNGLKNGDSPGVTGDLVRASGENKGKYAIEQGSLALTDMNYTFTFLTDSLTIRPTSLTITAYSATKVYGETDPTLVYRANGFVNGDDSTIVSGNLSRNTGENAGVYSITLGNVKATDNYIINFNNNSFTIDPASLDITADPQTKTYGDADPVFTYVVNGLTNGDQPSIITGNLSRSPGKNIGTYAITQGSINAGNNYIMTYSGDFLTITPASLNIKANPKVKVYGNGDPIFTYVIDGLIDGDTITGNLDRASGENVGTYVINQGNISAGSNYITTYTADSLSITPASLTITANPQTKVHGDADPIFTYTINGFVNGDDSSIITGALNRNTGESVGTYAITQGNISAGTNYSIIYLGDSLTITPALGISNTTASLSGQIQVYPNPVNAGAKLNIVSSYSVTELKGAYLQLIDLTGKVLQHSTTVAPNMQITMPQTTGIYLVNLVLANGQKTCVKILVHE